MINARSNSDGTAKTSPAAARVALALVFALMLTLEVKPTQAQETVLYSFCPQSSCADGASPAGGLVQGSDGNFYGTTEEGGTNNGGTVFQITPSGTPTTLYSFCAQRGCPDGEYPFAGLVQGTDGNFYGATQSGGPSGLNGTVFQISSGGTLTTLYTFCLQSGCPDGEYPGGDLVQGSDGNFYGTTEEGGTNNGGTVFQITPSGTLTTLYNFCSQSGCTDGEYLYAGLVQGTDGNFYGTTGGGGAQKSGTIFQITPSGTLTTLHSFCSQSGCTDGKIPDGGLVQGSDGNFYGTTAAGGTSNSAGTVFQITPSGTLTTLYSFCPQSGCADGRNSQGRLVQGSDGNFYGTTYAGGTRSGGTVFQITPSGTLTTLYSFCSQGGCTDGKYLYAGLVQGTDGNFYGTTYEGGTGNNGGVVFKYPQTSTAIASSLNPSSFGQSVTFTATVSGLGTPTGSVAFMNGTATLGNAALTGGVASFTTNTLGPGTDPITAVYGGNLAGSTSPVLNQVVTRATSTITLTSSQSPSTYGQSVTFTATVASGSRKPGGRVKFLRGTATLGSATLTGGVASLTTTTLNVGASSVIAVYEGNNDYSGSTSSAQPQTVNRATTTVALTSSQNPSTLGQLVTFTATVAPQFSGTTRGKVGFFDGRTRLSSVTLASGVATYNTSSLASGTHTITATYDGNEDFSSSSMTLMQTVN